jgi:hypothetical protein
MGQGGGKKKIRSEMEGGVMKRAFQELRKFHY